MGFFGRLLGRATKPNRVKASDSATPNVSGAPNSRSVLPDVPTALATALKAGLSPRMRQATEFALRYVQAVTFLDECGEFTLEKLRRTYDVAGLAAPGTHEETQSQWEKSKLILLKPGSPGGSEFIRQEMRTVLLEGVANAAPHVGSLEGPLRSWLEQKRVPPVAALPVAAAKAPTPGTSNPVTLADANQFLRYRAGSKAKVDAQVALMDALLARHDAPPVKAILLRSVDPNDEFPWLIVKSGTHGALAEMRGYAGFKETFKSLFGDQPFSIAWADHIAENCPGPGEAVTARGREEYARIEHGISAAKYVIERHIGAGRS